MEWWGENLTDGVKRRGNGDSKNIQPDREGCEGKQGPEKFLLFVSLFFKGYKNNGMFNIDSNKSHKEQKADCCRKKRIAGAISLETGKSVVSGA